MSSRAEEILKSIVGDEAKLEPPMSRVEVLLYRLKELIEGGAIDNPIKIKGRVDTVLDLPQNATPGDFYFVGFVTDDEFKEYIYTTDHRWELLGTSDLSNVVKSINGMLPDDSGNIELEIPKFRDLTLEQYNNLMESEKNNGTYYNIIEE